MENISEQTANELIDAFGKIAESSEQLYKDLSRFNKTFAANIAQATSEKLLSLYEKYANGNVFTRWYYKRKLKKVIDGLPELFGFIKDVFENAESSETVEANSKDIFCE